MSFQKEYEDYLAHFGVPRMKWGVRKSVYKSMNRNQKRALRAYATSVGRHTSVFASRDSAKVKARKKADDRQKARLEKALGTKINSASAAGSYKNHNLANYLLNPIGNVGSVIANSVRSSRNKGYSEMSAKELNEFVGSKKKKK